MQIKPADDKQPDLDALTTRQDRRSREGMTDPIDARDLLAGLTGQLIHTLTGAPNRILRVEAADVIVATGKSPAGQPVRITRCGTGARSSARWWRRCRVRGRRCGRGSTLANCSTAAMHALPDFEALGLEA